MVVRDLDARDDDDDDLLLLTAAHVCGSLSPAGPGQHRVLHHAVCASQNLGHPLGEVRRHVPDEPTAIRVPIDAAVIKPNQNITLQPAIGRGRPPAGVRDLLSEAPDDFVVVYKDGAATGPTEGLLEPVSADEYTDTHHYTQGWWIEGTGGDFARRGDSGSVVTDEEGLAIGLTVAVNQPERGQPTLTFCQAIVPVLQALRIELPS
jgi:hypothetical protein